MTKYVPTFVDATDFVASLKKIEVGSVAGENFISESLNTIKRHGFSHGTLNHIVHMSGKSTDPSVQLWSEDMSSNLRANNALMQTGLILESFKPHGGGTYAALVKPYLDTLEEFYGKSNDEVIDEVAVKGRLDNATVKPIRNFVNQVKADYYSQNGPTASASVSIDCKHPLAVVQNTENGLLLYFDGMLLVLKDNVLSPTSFNKVKLDGQAPDDFEKLCIALNSIKSSFDYNQNKFVSQLAIGSLESSVNDDGEVSTVFKDQQVDLQMVFAEHTTYSKLHKNNVHNLAKLQQDDAFLMNLKFVMSRQDRIAILDNVYACTQGRQTEYVMMFQDAHYTTTMYTGAMNSFTIQKHNTLSAAIDSLSNPSFKNLLADKNKSLLSNEAVTIQSRNAARSLYEEQVIRLDDIIRSTESTINELKSKPFAVGNTATLESNLASLQDQRVELAQRLAEVS